MIKQAYINGFMRKCAERGVDPVRVIKQAKVEGWGATKALAFGVPAAVAALAGGGASYALTKDKKKKLRNALIAAIIASGAGAFAAGGNMGRVGALEEEQNLVDVARLIGNPEIKYNPVQTALRLHGLVPGELLNE